MLSRDIGFGEGFEIYDDSEVPLRGDIRKLVNAISKMSWLGMAFEERKLIMENMKGVSKVIPQKTLSYSSNLIQIKY